MGYSSEALQKSKEKLQSYIDKLQDAIRELRTSYDGLLNRFEEFHFNEFIGEQLEFEEYKDETAKPFQEIEKTFVFAASKNFYSTFRF